jgi:CheY-like chemotaxis protein
MLALIDWILTIERLAGETYALAGSFFAADPPLQKFLLGAAEDEAWHCHVLAQAAAQLGTDHEIPLDILLDQDIRARLETIFARLKASLDQGTLTKEALADGIGEAEFSEWNDVFLYLVNRLKQDIREFASIPPKIENHKRTILNFYRERPEGNRLLQRLRQAKPVWQERILVVEDDEALRELLGSILAEEGEVDTAPNGRIGLEMARSCFYRAIVSDIDMPELNGLDMFQALREDYPAIGHRFAFMSGNLTPERQAFMRDHGAEWLGKPSSIREIRECVVRILLRGGSQ